jgi:hypothetical protein
MEFFHQWYGINRRGERGEGEDRGERREEKERGEGRREDKRGNFNSCFVTGTQ